MLETLCQFNSLKDFSQAFSPTHWLLRDISLEERKTLEKDHPFLNALVQLGHEHEISDHVEEALSWCDSITMLYRLIELNILKEEIINHASIMAEYRMPYSNKRIDYLLCLNKKYLIIEFSLCRSHQKDSLRYGQELDQAIEYKALLSNIVGQDYEVAVFSYLIYPEIDASNNTIKFNLNKNSRGLHKLGEFINYYFTHDEQAAYNHLEDIQKSRI